MLYTKQLLLVALITISALYTNAQFVGIGTNTPTTQLEVLTSDAKYGIVHTNGTIRMATYIGSGAAWIGTQTNHPLYFFANNFGAAEMSLTTNGNVGIGTISPAYNLDIHSAGNAEFNLAEANGAQTALFSRYSNRLEIQPSDAFEISIAGIDNRNLCIATNGYTGINTATPTAQLEVLTVDGSYGMVHTNGTIRVGTYVGGGGGWIGTQTNHPLYFFTNNSSPLMTLGTNGYLGIGSTTPTNKLQVGPTTAFSGWDIAFGNGTQTTGLLQTAAVSEWYSNTNIALMPKGNGQGFVGINTTTPQVPLEVDSYVQGSYSYAYYKAIEAGGIQTQTGSCNSCTANVSIYASNNVMALEFDAQSDARIKDIEGVTNSTQDLQTLNAIQVTDYTLKDKVKTGDKQFKKIIAQQVEEVYPQVVSKNPNYIPNVYQFTNKIGKTASGYLLSFKTVHNINKEAKKLQLIDKSGTQQRYDIIAIPSDKEVLIDAPDLKSDTVFVYGEQVNDFRTVDYDGLTTLNISATQELSKLVKQQQAEIDAQNAKIDELMEMIKKLKRKH